MRYTLKQLEGIHSKYMNEGLTLSELSKHYNSDFNYLFKRYNLERLTAGDFKRINRDRYYEEIMFDFSIIDSQEAAYILGVIYADGWISGFNLGIKVILSDEKWLVQIKNYICPGLGLRTEKNSIKFGIHSKKIVDNLIKLGVKYKKSDKINNIPNIDSSLLRHFIRGVFDGDGSVFKDRLQVRANICSTSVIFLQEIQYILQSEGIDCNINKEARKGKEYKLPQGTTTICNQDMYRLFINKKKMIPKLFTYLYKDAILYLERKLNRFKEYTNTEVS